MALRALAARRYHVYAPGGQPHPAYLDRHRRLPGGGPVKMPSTRVRAVAMSLAVLLAGCSQFKVQSKQDPSVSFVSMGTFAWLPKTEAEPADQSVQHRGFDRQIRADVDKALREKGYVPATDGHADFLLNYRV